ncbi:helix-turn-helix domain-containing protein [Glaciecola sp. MH2013]|uniref:helix-turn-helix domain-containing protein n=1 Tax=Glaciecola sp. MH2013 TaxID=2785524 RepID=UPI00189D74A1|nr:helix-turn-helix domain-containing protein [Glaciecola sp. MH2013]MBF7073713.1 helix-turn-helix domain-containing protein [Glaciecola sp. MH2013]
MLLLIDVVFICSFIVALALLFVLAKRNRNAKNHIELLNRRVVESDQAQLKALELVSQQQTCVNNIGKQIQSCLSHELTSQHSYLNQAFCSKDRRQSRRDNWNKIVALSERLFHFSMREQSREHHFPSVRSSDVLDSNRKLLEALCKLHQQKLMISERRHVLLALPIGILDKIIRGAVHALLNSMNAPSSLDFVFDSSDSYALLRLEAEGRGFSHSELKRIEVSAALSPNLVYSKRSQDNEEGLNLANVKRLVNEFGGDINIVSALNYTTRIFIKLPIVGCELPNDKSITSDKQQDTISTPPVFAKSSVLIVDNSDVAQMQIHRALQQQLICYACKQPLETLQMIHNLSPDIIYLEQSIEGIGCVELIRLIRNNPKTSHLPIIVSCDLASQSFKFAALKAGASHVIDKPVAIVELELLLLRLLKNSEELAHKVGESISKYHSDQVVALGSDEDEKDDDFIERFNLMIANNFGNEDLTRELAAKHLNVTQRTLNRRLKAYYSHNFIEYLKKYRLERGKELLLQGEQISETAFSVGFSAPSYFSTCFRAEYGITPSQLSAKRA